MKGILAVLQLQISHLEVRGRCDTNSGYLRVSGLSGDTEILRMRVPKKVSTQEKTIRLGENPNSIHIL